MKRGRRVVLVGRSLGVGVCGGCGEARKLSAVKVEAAGEAFELRGCGDCVGWVLAADFPAVVLSAADAADH